MPELSLYTPPQERYATLDTLGFSGRIGRLRLLAWHMVLTAIACAASIVVLLTLKLSPTLGITCGATLLVAYCFISVRISAQRLHDINWSAWMLLLHVIPLANLVLLLMMLLMPGTPGPNKYGLPPPPNSRAVNVLACTAIFLIALGMVAMIALFALGLLASLINAANSNSL
ncbi:DUF805 domain-containing protein [Pseudomonas sp.]|uniref:DUF805 domain-containing protein n=1 Tax=Pseudomonas sp. TaxID=306 RepID=UPI00260C7A71|nr:DUF805 domain-containing protein [Pseudomonas sp.]